MVGRHELSARKVNLTIWIIKAFFYIGTCRFSSALLNISSSSIPSAKFVCRPTMRLNNHVCDISQYDVTHIWLRAGAASCYCILYYYTNVFYKGFPGVQGGVQLIYIFWQLVFPGLIKRSYANHFVRPDYRVMANF